MIQQLTDIDTGVFLFFNGMHSPFWDGFMFAYSGKWIWLPLYAALLAVLLRNYDKRSVMAFAAAVALMVFFTDFFTSSVVRPHVMRLRPSNPDNPISGLVHVVQNYRGGSFGFPSAHSSNVWGLAVFSALVFRKPAVCGFMALWAAVTCYSRLYLGVHYPGDLLSGMLVGITGAGGAYWVFKLAGGKPAGRLEWEWLPAAVGSATIAYIAAVSATDILGVF